MRKKTLFFAMMALLSLCACSEKSTTPNDEAVTGDVDIAGDELLSDTDTYDFWKDGPQRPHPVDWGTCPEGWEPKEEKDEEGNLLAKYCEPILPPEGTECEPGYFAMFGSTECQRIGDECPAGEFADIPTDAGTEIVYVSEGESIQEAIDAAQAGAVIAIGKGTFDEFVTITDKNITLWGACVEGTILSPTTPMEDEATDAIIRIDGTNPEHKVVVKNLTLTGGQRRGMNITGITAEVSHVEIVSAKKGGVLVDYGGSLTASSVRIRDTLSDSSNASGVGMALYDDVTVLLDRVILERNRTVGIHAVSTGISQVHFEATDMIVRDTQEQEGEKDLGNGIFLLNNVTAVLKRVLIERNRNIGLAAATENGDTKCSLQAEDIVVRDTRSTQNDQTEGKGIFVARNTEALLARTLIEENRYVGMVVASDVEGVSARLSASDTIVKDTEAQEAPEAQKSGRGISLEGNVQMTFSRILLQNNKEAGLVAKTENTEFLCSIGGDSLMVRETKETVDEQKDGRGIHLENNVSANFDRVLVEKNRTMGLSALTLLEGAQGSLQMTDFIIRDTQAQKSDHRFGEGVFVQEAFTVDLRRGAIVDNREAGVFLLDALDMYTAPPTVTLSDVKISGTKIRECSELKIDCVYAPDAPFGHGLGVYDGAEATLRNVEITNNTNGIQIRDSKVFSGDECSLAACSGTGIPVCLLLKDNETAINAFELPADYDINTAFAEGKTCYEGNDTNFSSEEQAVPEPPDPPEM